MQIKLFCAVILFALVSIHASTSPVETKKALSVQNNFSDSLKNSKAVYINSVRLHPNPTTNGVITVDSNVEVPVHFYVFDHEATLIHRLVLKGKERKKISNLQKGTYIYDVFKNNESIEQGKIIVN